MLCHIDIQSMKCFKERLDCTRARVVVCVTVKMSLMCSHHFYFLLFETFHPVKNKSIVLFMVSCTIHISWTAPTSLQVIYCLTCATGTLFISFLYVHCILIYVLTTCFGHMPLSSFCYQRALYPCRTETQMDTVGIHSQPGWHTSLPSHQAPHRMATHHRVTSGGFLIYPLAMKWFKC